MTDYQFISQAMAILGILITLGWVVLGIFGPPIKKASRNVHNAWSVKSNGDPFPLVQEVGEWKLCKIIGIAVGVLAHIIALQFGGLAHMAAAILMVFADSFSRTVFALDAGGHGAEIIAATEAGVDGYRDGEIKRLLAEENWQKALGFSKPAKGKAAPGSREKVEAALAKWHWLAKIIYRLGR